jgi:hypothetical protein
MAHPNKSACAVGAQCAPSKPGIEAVAAAAHSVSSAMNFTGRDRGFHRRVL